ncbi:hypothetical protein [Arsukibacterium sp.]|uniref:hypothetical protein n=1 Tax=Arsukibacterium sp. TaxID=1977258 RepID=UPI002FD95C12
MALFVAGILAGLLCGYWDYRSKPVSQIWLLRKQLIELVKAICICFIGVVTVKLILWLFSDKTTHFLAFLGNAAIELSLFFVPFVTGIFLLPYTIFRLGGRK